MKIKEEGKELEKLLNGLSKQHTDTIDKIPSEIEPTNTPFVLPKPTMKTFGPLKIPKEICTVCENIKKIMTTKGLYNAALDLQIFTVATQIVAFEKVSERLVTGDFVKYSEISTLAETIRKSLRELNITNYKTRAEDSIPSDNDPLMNLVNSLNNSDDDEIIKKS